MSPACHGDMAVPSPVSCPMDRVVTRFGDMAVTQSMIPEVAWPMIQVEAQPISRPTSDTPSRSPGLARRRPTWAS